MADPYKAPPNWQPTSDQMQQIHQDARLQRMSKDDLYLYFNNQRGGSGAGSGGTWNPTSTAPQPRRAAPPPTTGGIFGWVDQVRKALGGS